MIGYVTLGTEDMDKARAYFDALFGVIGAKRLMQLSDEEGGFTMYGTAFDKPAVALTRPYNGEEVHCGNGNMIALTFDSKARVDAFHAKALELGGSDEGAPGYRGDPKTMGFYGSYFRDPEGHKFCAFCVAPEQ